MAKQQFDWIDDAFDDKKTAEDMEKARGPKLAGVLVVVVLLLFVALIAAGVVALGSLSL